MYKGKFNIQKLRQQYSTLPVLKHHLCTVAHGRQITHREDNLETGPHSRKSHECSTNQALTRDT